MVWRGFRVRPVARSDPDPGNPVDPSVAPPAVQDPRAELPLQVPLHLEQLQADELRLEDRAVFGKAGGLEVIDQCVGPGRLLGDGGDGSLEDVSLALHGARS